MKKAIFVSILLVSVFMLAFAIPTSAQDGLDYTRCVHIEITTDDTGQYVYIFIYQDDFDKLFDPTFFPDFEIQVTEPNTILTYNTVVAPQNLLLVATPLGGVKPLFLKMDNSIVFMLGQSSCETAICQ